ncbi:hypothetical protein [Companilactobacillus zhachilii]|uniref:hypothetical protein n=1 Tax=Companilactobacillus zhachilii TaxID=2304606 RepID=UPI00403424DC
MKLGKSLIITGLLFSSVLGSVNVNNITAVAATSARTSLEEEGEEAPDMTVNALIDYKTDDSSIDMAAFKEASDKTLPVNLKTDVGGEDAVDISHIKIAEGFQIAHPKAPLRQTTDGYEVTVVIEKKVITVPVEYYDKNDKVIPDDEIYRKGLFKNMNLKQNDKGVTKENLNGFPDGFEFVKYENGKVILKEKVNPAPNPAPNPTRPIKPSKGGHRGYTAQRVRISFIDQDGDEVGYKQLNGKDTFSSKIEAPAGYTLVNSSDATIKFDKKGNKDIKIKVTKNRPTPVMEKGIVTTNSGLYFHLYTIDGKEITNRGLSGDSKWFTDQYATINGEKMFRVATNEWVKATDVYK